ncbi:MAG: hypothetical protein MN733_42045, partial [Nitrososphaera sp.]|nr:hypothetical protein [Nitrososphaera sp.]
EELGSRLGQILKNIYVPDEILAQLTTSLLTDKSREETIRKQQQERLQQRLAVVRRRVEQAYVDKLDGKISEDFWLARSAEWRQEEQQVLHALQGVKATEPERLLDAVRILELANKAHFLYLKQPSPERARLLRMVLSNCAVDAVSVYPTYRKPFDLIFNAAQTGEWRARRDSNSRPSGS